MNFTKLSIILILSIISAGCASKPILYPNRKYQAVGKDMAKKDINLCMAKADRFLESSKGKAILKSAGRGSVFGAVVGGITGLFTGDVTEALAGGAAIGAAGGATAEAITPDRLKQSFVTRCLQKKGYEVVGWD